MSTNYFIHDSFPDQPWHSFSLHTLTLSSDPHCFTSAALPAFAFRFVWFLGCFSLWLLHSFKWLLCAGLCWRVRGLRDRLCQAFFLMCVRIISEAQHHQQTKHDRRNKCFKPQKECSWLEIIQVKVSFELDVKHCCYETSETLKLFERGQWSLVGITSNQ